MSEPNINAQIAARLLKTGVEVLECGIENEHADTVDDGWLTPLSTGVTTLTIKIYDPSRDEVK